MTRLLPPLTKSSQRDILSLHKLWHTTRFTPGDDQIGPECCGRVYGQGIVEQEQEQATAQPVHKAYYSICIYIFNLVHFDCSTCILFEGIYLLFNINKLYI